MYSRPYPDWTPLMVGSMTVKQPKSLKRHYQATAFKVEKKIDDFSRSLAHKLLRTFEGKMEFKNFSRTFSKIQGLSKTIGSYPGLKNICCKKCQLPPGVLVKLSES